MAVPLVVMLGVAAGSGAAAFVKKASHSRGSDQWKAAASQLGLAYNRGQHGHLLTGITDGFNVRVETVPYGSAHATRYHLEYVAQYQELFALTKETRQVFTTTQANKTDIEIGDDRFDQQVLIDAADAEAMARFLTQTRRSAVLHLFSQPLVDATITNSTIHARSETLEPTTTEIVTTIADMALIADTLSAPVDAERSTATPTPSPTTPRHLTLVPPITSTPQDAVRPSRTEETPTAPAEDPLASLPTPVLPAVLPEPPILLPREEPAEPDVAEPTVIVTSELPPPPILVEADSISLDQAEVISDLFCSTRMGFETDELFASTYVGKTINWTGTVDAYREFQHDPDFDEPGQKVTLVLGSDDDSALLTHRIFAVIALPTDVAVERGETLTFSGTLQRLDRFTKQFVVGNAELGEPLAQTG